MITVYGGDDVRDALKALTSDVSKKVVKDAFRDALKALLPKIKAAAPVGPTGRLSAGFKVRAPQLKRKRGQYIGASIVTVPRKELDPPAKESKWYYPAHVEFGSSRRPPNPFMRGPLKASEQSILEGVRRAIASRIARASKKTASPD